MSAEDDPLDVRETLRNILLILQQDPIKYRCFGIWWWPVKALLRKFCGRRQLYLLGSYEDPDGAARVPALPLHDTLRAALEEYALNLRYNLGRSEVQDRDGAPYTLIDPDAGGI